MSPSGTTQDHQALLEAYLRGAESPHDPPTVPNLMRKMPHDLASLWSDFCWLSVKQKWQIERPSESSLLSGGQNSLSSRNSQTTILLRLRISPKPPFLNWPRGLYVPR